MDNNDLNKIELNTTYFRKNMSDILNEVFFRKKTAILKRGEKIIAKIVHPDLS